MLMYRSWSPGSVSGFIRGIFESNSRNHCQTHQKARADVRGSKSLTTDATGRRHVFSMFISPRPEADNTTLMNTFLKLTLVWGLCNNVIWRPIYHRPLLFISPELCTAVLLWVEDRFHCSIMIRIVQKHIEIDYVDISTIKMSLDIEPGANGVTERY
jgi:hypothetical protein